VGLTTLPSISWAVELRKKEEEEPTRTVSVDYM